MGQGHQVTDRDGTQEASKAEGQVRHQRWGACQSGWAQGSMHGDGGGEGRLWPTVAKGGRGVRATDGRLILQVTPFRATRGTMKAWYAVGSLDRATS